MKFKRFRALLLLAILAAGPLCFFWPRPVSQARLPLAFFDWQPATPLAPELFETLKSSDAETYVRAGSFVFQEGRWIFQRELDASRVLDYRELPWHAALRFELPPGSKSLSFPDKEEWPRLAGILAAEAQRWRAYGSRGLMLDLDCAASSLGDYAGFLELLRSRMAEGQLSITVLPSWMWRPLAFRRLVANLDFYAPLFFGGEIPASLSGLQAMAQPAELKSCLRLARLYGKPLVPGLGVYSQTLVYSQEGRLLSMEGDLGVDDLLAAPGLRFLGSQRDSPWGGWRHVFHAPESLGLAGRRIERGWQVLVQEPDHALLEAQVECIRAQAGSQLRRLGLYRLNKSGGGTVWQAAAAVQVGEPDPLAEPFAQASWKLLKKQGGAWWIELKLDYPWPYPSRLGGKAALLQLRCRGARIEDAWPGDFQLMERGQGFEEGFTPSSPQRADTLIFKVLRLEPGASLRAGPIIVRPLAKDFALYLYSSLDSPLAARRNVVHDFEVFPNPAPVLKESLELR